MRVEREARGARAANARAQAHHIQVSRFQAFTNLSGQVVPQRKLYQTENYPRFISIKMVKVYDSAYMDI